MNVYFIIYSCFNNLTFYNSFSTRNSNSFVFDYNKFSIFFNDNKLFEIDKFITYYTDKSNFMNRLINFIKINPNYSSLQEYDYLVNASDFDLI